MRNDNNIRTLHSRSYANKVTTSDHKSVIAKIQIRWKDQPKHKHNRVLNIENFKNETIAENFNTTVKLEMQKLTTQPKTIQERWNKMTKILHTSAEETIGFKRGSKKSVNEDIIHLSKLQRKIQIDIEKKKKEEQKQVLKHHRNHIMNVIHYILRQDENEKIHQTTKNFERLQNNEQMYEAVKKINQLKPREKLLIKTEKGLTNNPKKQAEIIAKYFKSIFWKDADKIPAIQPIPMEIPFSTNEVKDAANKLKSNRSPGSDNISRELIKNSPDTIHQNIAETYNIIAATGEFAKEINKGILTPPQKPGKAKGPVTNLRPIILLATLRKILATCLMKRIKHKLDVETPHSQAAYRKNRSTTEHVLATKLMIDRTLNSEK